jgi:hypothetical protein
MAHDRVCVTLTLELLRPDQYRQVAEWAHGPQGDVDWDDYAAYMNDPRRANFGIYLGAEFVGCLFLEIVDRNMVECHIATARRKIHPNGLARVLFETAADVFALGYTAVVARIPRRTRAAARLALRCGMREWGHTPEMRYFILTKQRFQRYAE